jgi:Kdo2-lipid IVA lauroyltransferase/acyltransferase
MPDSPLLPLLAPRHWPTWLGVGLLRALVVTLPVDSLLALGRWLGRLAMPFAGRRRRITDINLGLCFPDLSETERRALARRHFESLGMAVFEFCLGWWAPDARLAGRVRVEGMEHLHAAFERGKGVILLSAHFTTLEIGGRFLAIHTCGLPLNAMYRRSDNPVVERVLRERRRRHFGEPIGRDDVRAMVRALKGNEAVWYAFDQNYRAKNKVFAPFFGVAAATNTATSRLAQATGAAVVPFFTRRLPDGTGYVQRIAPPLADFPSGDAQADATRLNALIEGWVREAPEQYLWSHRRFKTRPAGEAPFY